MCKESCALLSCIMNVLPRYKIMLDGSFFEKTGHSSWGFVVFTMTNSVLHVAAGSSKRGSIQVAEFKGALEAVQYAVKMNLKPGLIG